MTCFRYASVMVWTAARQLLALETLNILATTTDFKAAIGYSALHVYVETQASCATDAPVPGAK